MKERDPRAFLPQPGTVPKCTCPSLSLGGLLTPAGEIRGSKKAAFPPNIAQAPRPSGHPPTLLGRAIYTLDVARGSCLLDEAQPPRATGWIEKLLRGQGSRMQARNWLFRAL